MSDRNRRIIRQVTEELAPILKGILAGRIAEYYSESVWDQIVNDTLYVLSDSLARSPVFASLTSEGDIRDDRGRFNAAGVITAIESLRDESRNTPQYPLLGHLAAHLRHVLGDRKMRNTP